MDLSPLYHWSPRERRANILRRGLLPGRRSVAPAYDDDGVYRFRQPGVCLGPSPAGAWAYSAAIFGEPGTTWDLWEVRLAESDETHVQPVWGDRIVEVRVHNRIPKSRLWWVGERLR